MKPLEVDAAGSPVETEAAILEATEADDLADIGCPGWLGSVEFAKAEPNLNWASVESMTNMSQSQLGFNVASMSI